MNPRTELLDRIAARIVAIRVDGVLRVAIDGVDGAGKSTFADELARPIEAHGRPVIRASVDGFHHPRAIRYLQGRDSPRGFFEDSYDYAVLRTHLLDPLGPAGSRRYRSAAFDHRRDRPVEMPERAAPEGAILLFDGIFLHRPGLRALWDLSIFLDVSTATSVARCAARDGSSPDPAHPANRRYVEGQRLYLTSCTPHRHASIVIDNERLEAPRVIERS